MPYVPSGKTEGKQDDRAVLDGPISVLSKAIAEVSARHGYEGAFAGELNYSITRLLQEIPRDLMEKSQIKEELRYWLQPLMYGVLLDVVLEHKRRVNVAYEAAQIVKSGDCYDTPYYTRLIEIVDQRGDHIGYQEVMVKRSDATLKEDVLATILVNSRKNTRS